MKLILKENVAGLGYKDDIVEVKDGYGRNYLIPQRLAVIASAHAIRCLEEEQRQRAHKLAKIKADAEEFAKSLEGIKLVIPARAAATGAIYGSVNALRIAEELAKIGHEVDRKLIFLKDTVKELGSYNAVVRPHKEVQVEIAFDVVPEEENTEK